MTEQSDKALDARVALRKESVDRNAVGMAAHAALLASLSARRAWIEIPARRGACHAARWSLSARRAWIEIIFPSDVARKKVRRSPQGERG